MKKITTMLNTPAKIAGFAACVTLLIAIIVFAAIQASAGIDENKSIGMDKGVNVALEDAGFKAEDVENLSAHYDTEDGISVYEVSFTAGGYEYEYVVRASNGKIIEADRDAFDRKKGKENSSQDNVQNENSSTLSTDNNSASKPSPSEASDDSGKTTTSSEPSSNYIGIDKAKSIALKDAGLSDSSVTFTKAKLDREDGIRVYEIEFFTRDMEYEYEINATSGKIRDKDIEFNDDWDDDDWDDDDWDD